MLNETKINPAMLRLFVIFPNVLSYFLLFGIIVYIMTNFQGLVAADALNIWLIAAIVLAPMAIFTTFSIVKRIKAGTL